MAGTSTVVDRVRNPEYTGENRCVPCTVVNLVIALVASAVVALVAVGLGAAAAAAPVAAVVLAVSLAAIYLRGYLVPGTPALTRRYLPERVLAWFGKDPAEATRDGPQWDTIAQLEREREQSVDPDAFLREVGAVDVAADPPAFTDGFARRVDANLEDAADPDPAALAPLFGADPGDVEPLDRDHPAVRVDHRIREWPSAAALRTDLATHRALADLTDRWAEVPTEQRLDVLRSLRSYHAVCPACGSALELEEEAVEACCGAFEVSILTCPDCPGRLLELDPAAAADADSAAALRVPPEAVRGN